MNRFNSKNPLIGAWWDFRDAWGPQSPGELLAVLAALLALLMALWGLA